MNNMIMHYGEDLLIESLQYELYLFNKQISSIRTNLCLAEASIYSNIQEVITEGELGTKIKTALLGAQSTGRFDLIRPRLLKAVAKAKTMDIIEIYRYDARMSIPILQTYKKQKPQFAKQADEQIAWIRGDFRDAIDARAKQIKAAIKESALEDFALIQEEAKNSFMDAIRALIKKLKEIWDKYIGRWFQRNKDDEEWLKANKDVILKNKHVGSFEIYKFWERSSSIDKIKIPDFNYTDMKPHLAGDDAFVKQYFPDLYKDGIVYSDVAKGLFYGEKTVVKDTQVPIDKMYTFCSGGFKQSNNALKAMFDKAINAANATLNDIQSGKIQTESTVCLERYFYSYLLENVVYEEELVKDVNDGSTSNQSNNTNTQSEPEKKEESDKAKSNSQSKVEAQRFVNRYITVCTNINAVIMKTYDDT